jgi:hypothetical protein
VAPGSGSTSGAERDDSPKRPLPPTEITGLTVASVSDARPPQPVRVSASVLPASHSSCWSLCENRLSGTMSELEGAARNCALVVGWNSGPTLKTGARRPSAQAGSSAASDGCRP